MLNVTNIYAYTDVTGGIMFIVCQRYRLQNLFAGISCKSTISYKYGGSFEVKLLNKVINLSHFPWE